MTEGTALSLALADLIGLTLGALAAGDSPYAADLRLRGGPLRKRP